MKPLSRWAKGHPVHARLIIIIARVLLFLLAFYLGSKFAKSGADISPLWLYGTILAFFLSGMFYPVYRKNDFSRRKTFDFLIAGLGFFILLFTAVNLNGPARSATSASAAVSVREPRYKNPESEKILNAFMSGEKKELSKQEKRIIKQEFKYQVKNWVGAKISGDKARANEALLIILACIAAAGLLYLVAALACTLSCNGSDVAAIIVGILGAAAVIWLLIKVIKSISRKSKPESASQE